MKLRCSIILIVVVSFLALATADEDDFDYGTDDLDDGSNLDNGDDTASGGDDDELDGGGDGNNDDDGNNTDDGGDEDNDGDNDDDADNTNDDDDGRDTTADGGGEDDDDGRAEDDDGDNNDDLENTDERDNASDGDDRDEDDLVGGDDADDGTNDNDDIDNLIINGFTPDRLDNPFVVRLIITFSDDRILCTGALLSPSWVVTAGHCCKDALSIEVQLGLYTRNEGALQTIIVSNNSIFVHENFVGTDTEIKNDIALVRLNPRANTFSPRIRPIRFACQTDGSFAGRTARSCGWGDTEDNATQSTETLQCVDMPVITNTECEPSWPTLLLPSHICTSTIQGRTPCIGDSGGPLFLDDFFNRPQLIGLTSFGSNPCEQDIPSVYTRITSYSRWITRRTLLLCDFV